MPCHDTTRHVTYQSQQVCSEHVSGAIVAVRLASPRTFSGLQVEAVRDHAQVDGVLDDVVVIGVLESDQAGRQSVNQCDINMITSVTATMTHDIFMYI